MTLEILGISCSTETVDRISVSRIVIYSVLIGEEEENNRVNQWGRITIVLVSLTCSEKLYINIFLFYSNNGKFSENNEFFIFCKEKNIDFYFNLWKSKILSLFY